MGMPYFSSVCGPQEGTPLTPEVARGIGLEWDRLKAQEAKLQELTSQLHRLLESMGQEEHQYACTPEDADPGCVACLERDLRRILESVGVALPSET